VELGIRVREDAGSRREIHGVQIRGSFLFIEEWDVRLREYRLTNATTEAMTVMVEHPRTVDYDLFDCPQPAEQTGEDLRFEVAVPGGGESNLRVQERRLLSRREGLRKQSYQGLQRYLRRGLLSRESHAKLVELLGLWEQVSDAEGALEEIDTERKKTYAAQQQIQGNMGALSATGKEGALRARYVEQLESSEDDLKVLGERESGLQAEIERLKIEIRNRIKELE
jgi:hypothetical protein